MKGNCHGIYNVGQIIYKNGLVSLVISQSGQSTTLYFGLELPFSLIIIYLNVGSVKLYIICETEEYVLVCQIVPF